MNAILCLCCMLWVSPVPPSVPAHRPVVVRATGIGKPPGHMKGPRAQLMARRAAEVTAVRNLARKMQESGRTLQGFRYVSTRRLQNGVIEVTVEAFARR